MTALSDSARPGALMLAVSIGLSALLGCGRDSSTESVPMPADSSLPLPAVTTELIDAGANPRVRLDRQARVGAVQHVVLKVHKDMLQQVDNQPEEHFVTPDVTIPLTATAGPHGIDLVLGTATSSDPRLTAKLAKVSSARAGLAMDRNGSVTALRLTTDAAAPPEARTTLERCLTQAILQEIVFPESPIGRGATWLIHRRVPGRMPLEQTTRAMLMSAPEGVLHIQVTVDQHTATGQLTTLSERTGMSPVVDEPVRGGGSVVLDRALPLPVDGDVGIDGDRRYRDPSGAIQLRQTTASSIRWSSH